MMQAMTVLRTLELPGGGVIPFPVVPGEQVRILYGRIRLTEEGSEHDKFLASGEEVRLDGRGLAVIEALSPARFELVEPVRARVPGRGFTEWLTRRLGTWMRPKRPLLT
jgi:hypothetical protein